MKKIIWNNFKLFAALAIFGVLLCSFGWARVPFRHANKPDFVGGELLLTLNTGTSLTDATGLANSVNADVIQSLSVPNIYLLKVRSVVTPGTTETDKANLMTLASQLSADARVKYARPNYLKYIHEIPNDSMYNLQWALPMMHFPQVWTSFHGLNNVIVAVLDSSFDTLHPDLASRLILPGKDYADNDTDVNPPAFWDFSHGTNVSGVIAAVTNNGIGVAGGTWSGIRILPIKIGNDANGADGGLSTAGILAGLNYVLTYTPKVGAVNMSYGGRYEDPDEKALLQQLIAAKIICVASAGNDGISVKDYPGATTGVLCISAVGPTKNLSSFSTYGDWVAFAAPGGEDGPATDGIYTTEMRQGYTSTEGTSFSSPYATAAVAMLLSAGVQPQNVKQALIDGADHLGQAVPNNRYGYGLINLEESFRVSGALGLGINFVTPMPFQVFETEYVPFTVNFFNLDPLTLEVRVDGTLKDESGNLTQDPNIAPASSFSDYLILAPGDHTISVKGTSIKDNTKSTTVTQTVSVQPHVLRSGRHMVAVPYPLTGATPLSIFGAGYKLLRYTYDQNGVGMWARFNDGGSQDSHAGMSPPDFFGHTDGTANSGAPLGVGWFADLNGDKAVIVDKPAQTSNYVIALHQGWNMVGNPFPYNVAWSTCQFEVSGHRYSITDASSLGYLRAEIWRYDTTGYNFDRAPSGQLNAWEASWVKALVPGNLVIKPIPASASRSSLNNPGNINVGMGGWLYQLTVDNGTYSDKTNYLGVSSINNGNQAKVSKPPIISGFISLNLPGTTPSETLSSDIRQIGQTTNTWTFTVTTDQPNSSATIRWNALAIPSNNHRITLEDMSTGTRIFMSRQNSYAFRIGGAQTVRNFRIIDELTGR